MKGLFNYLIRVHKRIWRRYYYDSKKLRKAIIDKDIAFVADYVDAGCNINVIYERSIPCGGSVCGSDYVTTDYRTVFVTPLDLTYDPEFEALLKKLGALTYEDTIKVLREQEEEKLRKREEFLLKLKAIKDFFYSKEKETERVKKRLQ